MSGSIPWVARKSPPFCESLLKGLGFRVQGKFRVSGDRVYALTVLGFLGFRPFGVLGF